MKSFFKQSEKVQALPHLLTPIVLILPYFTFLPSLTIEESSRSDSEFQIQGIHSH